LPNSRYALPDVALHVQRGSAQELREQVVVPGHAQQSLLVHRTEVFRHQLSNQGRSSVLHPDDLATGGITDQRRVAQQERVLSSARNLQDPKTAVEDLI